MEALTKELLGRSIAAETQYHAMPRDGIIIIKVQSGHNNFRIDIFNVQYIQEFRDPLFDLNYLVQQLH